MNIIKKDLFDNPLFLKKILIIIIGLLTHNKFYRIKKVNINGTENIPKNKKNNVLFISNHQTYFLDAIGIIHVLNSTLNGNTDNIDNLSYIFKPKLNTYYLAAKETMKSGILPKILSYTGAVLVERTWRKNGKNINRPINNHDINNINKAIKHGWVITFPQGTTDSKGRIRKGTSHIIKKNQPIVIPIRIENFNKRFEKKSLKVKNPSKSISICFKEPLKINYKIDTIDDITIKVKKSLEI